MPGSDKSKKIKKRKKTYKITSTTARTITSRSSSSSSSASDADSGGADGTNGSDSASSDVEMKNVADSALQSKKQKMDSPIPDERMEEESASGSESGGEGDEEMKGDPFASRPGTPRSVGKMEEELKAKKDNKLRDINLNRMAILCTMGAGKVEALEDVVDSIPIDKENGVDVYNVTNLRSRQAFALRWATDESFRSQDVNLRIGKSIFRIANGKGCMIEPASTSLSTLKKQKKDNKIGEPPATYQELFSNLRAMGEDGNAKKLCEMAGVKYEGNGILNDLQIAGILIHFMNNTEELSDLSLSPLTDHLGKLLAIFGISELARGFMADPPYDADIFIKILLKRIADGKEEETLMSAFFSENKSSFPGAPTGGAAVLENPLSSEAALTRLFKEISEEEFRELVASVASDVKYVPQKLTLAEIENRHELEKRGYVQRCEKIIGSVRDYKIDVQVPKGKDILATLTDLQEEMIKKFNRYKLQVKSLVQALPETKTELTKEFEDACKKKMDEVEQKKQALITDISRSERTAKTKAMSESKESVSAEKKPKRKKGATKK